MDSMIESAGCTIWFRADIRKHDQNPFFADTPFGRPDVIGVGNAFAERDAALDKVSEMERLLRESRKYVPSALSYAIDAALSEPPHD